MPGCRSSDFFCRVHLLVAVSTASMMSLTMVRGLLVIGLTRVVGENDRALAAIGKLDMGRCQMQSADYGLASVGAHLVQRAFETFTRRSEGSKRIVDCDAPIGACYDPTGD